MYIFLDVDGVLNCEADWRRPYTINPANLKEFAKYANACSEPKLVLISTWRTGFSTTGASSPQIQALENALAQYGLRIIDKTPESNRGRQAEVEYYIRRNGIAAGDYIIIDDDLSLYDEPNKVNLYSPDYKTGFTSADIKKIKRK